MTPERLNEIDHLPNVSIFTVRKLTQAIRNLRSRLADLEAKNQWIPISERLPEKEEEIMYWVGCPIDDIPHCGLGEISDAKGITHWRPLPEGPEEG